MKTTFVILIALYCGSLYAQGRSEILTPSTNSTYSIGGQLKFCWDSSPGVPNSYNIALWSIKQQQWITIATNLNSNTKKYTWNVPYNYESGTYVVAITNSVTGERLVNNRIIHLTQGQTSVPKLLVTPAPSEVALSVFPNPSCKYFTVSSQNVIAHLRVYNNAGREVLMRSIDSKTGIISNDLPVGRYYVVAITTHGEVLVTNIVIAN